MKWISAKEKTPQLTEPLMGYDDKNKRRRVVIPNYKATVLAYHRSRGVFKAEFTRRGWCEISSFGTSSIVSPKYWMPLPKKP